MNRPAWSSCSSPSNNRSPRHLPVMRTRRESLFDSPWRTTLKLLVAARLAAPGLLLAQTWTPLANQPSVGGSTVSIQMLMLLPDGTVMAQQAPTGTTNSTAWFRLTPNHGDYATGQWTQRG